MAEEEKKVSQPEMDALLSGVASDEGAPPRPMVGTLTKAVKPYDFRRQEKLSKERGRSLFLVHEAFASRAGPMLGSYLRTRAKVKFSSVEAKVYQDYAQGIAAGSVLVIVNMRPLPGSAIMEFGPEVSLAFIERLLGGTGTVGGKQYQVTPVSAALIASVVGKILPALVEAWSGFIALKPDNLEAVLNTQSLQIALPGDSVAHISFEITVGTTEGRFGICLPFSVLEPISSKLAGPAFTARFPKENSVQVTDRIKRQLERSHLTVSALLGGAEMSIGELLRLGRGDVVRLETPVVQDLVVMVGGRPKYRARPGIHRSRLAIQITSVLEADESGNGSGFSSTA